MYRHRHRYSTRLSCKLGELVDKVGQTPIAAIPMGASVLLLIEAELLVLASYYLNVDRIRSVPRGSLQFRG